MTKNPRRPRLTSTLPAVAGFAVAAVVLAGCSSGKHDAAAPSGSAAASAPPSTPVALPPAQIQATASKTGLDVRLHVGQVIEVILPPLAQKSGQTTIYTVTPAGSKALTPIARAPGFYTGAAAGTAKITVTQKPKCAAGAACPAHIVEVGSLTVIVWK